MKKYLLAFLLSTTFAIAQTTPTPKTSETELKLQTANLELAITKYQFAQMQLQNQAEKVLAPIEQEVNDALAKARTSRGLSPDYQYDMKSHQFVKPTPPAPVKPVAPQSIPEKVPEKPVETPKK